MPTHGSVIVNRNIPAYVEHEPENKAELVALLQYHVLSGRVYSDQVAAGEVATLSGKKLPIAVEKGAPRIGGAGVAKADLETTNGVIHVIDAVLLPKQ